MVRNGGEGAGGGRLEDVTCQVSQIKGNYELNPVRNTVLATADTARFED
jgi:hypothetical protein